MEGKRFDELSKAIAAMASRRSVVKGLVAGVTAGVGGVLRAAGIDAAARKRGLNEICRKPGDCADGLSCTVAEYGRKRCTCAGGESQVCDGICCQTLCTDAYGCADGETDPACYQECVADLCYGFNQTFNYNFNYQFNNQEQCEIYCAYETCLILT